jgi:hypothetical protein
MQTIKVIDVSEKPKMNRKMQEGIAIAFSTGDRDLIIGKLRQAIRHFDSMPESAWRTNLMKLLDFVESLESTINGRNRWKKEELKPAFSVFVKGNGKLPFYSFSALAGAFEADADLALPFCIGAGACRKPCYSVKAWRYPAAFCRQLQNSLLLASNTGRNVIKRAFIALPGNVTVRPYVDGDFRTKLEVAFWMSLAHCRSDLALYGYSKSFAQLLAYDATGKGWPTNYVLNLSSGHCHDSATVERIKQLPIYRGEFIALGKKGNLQHGSKAYNAEARKLAKEEGHNKVFVCPGLCGECTAKTHACGDGQRFNNIPIVILAH